MKKVVCYKFFFIIYKNVWMQFHWNNLLPKKQKCDTRRSKKYYENKKKVLKERAKNKFRELSEEDKNIKREYGRKRYHNTSKEDKKRVREYQKNYREAKKS